MSQLTTWYYCGLSRFSPTASLRWQNLNGCALGVGVSQDVYDGHTDEQKDDYTKNIKKRLETAMQNLLQRCQKCVMDLVTKT